MPDLNADIHDHSPADEQANTQAALAWIRAHPNRMPALLVAQILRRWTPYMKTYVGLPFEQFPDRLSSHVVRDVLLSYMSYTVFALTALGLLLTWKRKRQYLPVAYLAIALTVAQDVAFYGSPRFRTPIEPLLVLLVGGVFWWPSYNRRSVLTGLRAVTQGLPHQRFLNRA